MAINKVIYGNTSLIDLTGDTATASDVAQGKVFHLASGVQAVGTGGGGTPWDESFHFIPLLTVSALAGGTATGGGFYDKGQTVTLTATPNSGYIFGDWKKGGSQVSTSAIYTFTQPDYNDATYTASFIKNSATITVNAGTGGTASGSGTYTIGDTVTLTATPSTYYTFKNWTKNGVEVSTSASYSFTLTDATDTTYTANFIAYPTVNLTGTGNSTYCYVTINGTKYSGASSGIRVAPNSTITFGVYGYSSTYYGRVTIDGSQKLNVTDRTTKTYDWTVPSNVTTINMEMTYTSTSSRRNGRFVVTTS